MNPVMSPPLSNLQVEILKLYATEIPENNLIEIRDMISKYLMNKAMDMADQVWEERGYSDELMKEWLNEDNK
jgi:DNA primase large subunit